MRTEDLFKYGVTPKDGERKGERLKVLSIEENGIIATEWDKETGVKYPIAHGDFELWKAPKTLFEDRSIPCTVGNLKKAIASAGLTDDTRIYVRLHDFLLDGVEDAAARVSTINGKKSIVMF